MPSPETQHKLQVMADHKTARCFKCPQDTSSVGMVEKGSEVWIPSAEECDVIHILSNLDDYLIPTEKEEAVISEAAYTVIFNPTQSGPYSELRSSRNIPKIESPCWKPKMMRQIPPRTKRCAGNPYAAAVGDGKMYVARLPKRLPRPTSSTVPVADLAISLEDHPGWERVDFADDGANSTAHGP